jgi:type I restriction enzyme, R subunit
MKFLRRRWHGARSSRRNSYSMEPGWHDHLGLSAEELAFYDALEVNDSAVQVLGEPTLGTIARELTESVRHNVTIDWAVRENVRAQMRVRVKRILRRYGYPPDKQGQAMQTLLERAEVPSQAWAAA